MEDEIEEFEDRLNQLFENQEDEESLVEEILLILLLLFLLGSGYEDEDDLTPEDRRWLDEMYQMSVASAPGIAERNDGEFDMAPTVNRISHHVMGAYHYAYMVHATDDDTNYVWVLGEADHCGDCVGYSNMGPMPGSFWKQVALERNHFPQSPNLECKGLHCPCTISEADG